MSRAVDPDVVSHGALSASLVLSTPTSLRSFPISPSESPLPCIPPPSLPPSVNLLSPLPPPHQPLPHTHTPGSIFLRVSADWARQLSIAWSPSPLTVVYIFPLKGERRCRPICGVNEARRCRQSHSCRHVGLALHFQLFFSLTRHTSRGARFTSLHLVFLLFFSISCYITVVRPCLNQPELPCSEIFQQHRETERITKHNS